MKHVRRAAAIALVTAAMPAALAAASGSLSGTYRSTVKTVGTLDGTYQIVFSPGRFVLHAPYGITGYGTYAISGSRITLHGPGTCKSAGTYEFKNSGGSLTFKKIKDPCPRAPVMIAHSWKRV